MNVIERRLRRLEERARPRVNEPGETPADVVRARRRRRLEAAGLPFEERPGESFAGTRSRGEIIRLSRGRLREPGACLPVGAHRHLIDSR
jgi:hypothetical protein